MDSKASSSSSSISSSGAAPLAPPPAIGTGDSHGTYADKSRSSSSSAVSLTPMDSKPSTSSTDNSPDVDQLISYLRSLSLMERGALDLCTVSLKDLTEASLIDPPLLENHNAIFMEALRFAETEKTFIAVPCYFCNNFNSSRTFPNSLHVLKEHIGTPSPGLVAMVPEQAPDWWIRDDVQLRWSPLDAATFQSATSSPERKRIELLARIEPVFEYLAGHGIFALNHFEVLIELAIATIPAIRSRQWLVEATSKQPNVCIRVLGAPQLEIALRFMEALKACMLNINYTNFAFEEIQEDKYQLFLEPGEVTVYLKKYGRRPGDLVRWLYDSSTEVSRSSWKDAAESREHKIRLVTRKYLQGLVHMGRACHRKQRRMDYINAMNNHRFLSQEDLQDRLCRAHSIEKIVIGEILQVMTDLQEPSQQNCKLQDVIQKKINQLKLQCLLSDARILSATRFMEEMQSKIGKASKLDYRIVVTPLMISCIKKRLYDLFEQYVRNQSKSKGEAQKIEPSDQPRGEGLRNRRIYNRRERYR